MTDMLKGGGGRINPCRVWGEEGDGTPAVSKKRKACSHFLSAQPTSCQIRKSKYHPSNPKAWMWRMHARKFVGGYFSLAFFCDIYQAWLFGLEFILGSKISFKITRASRLTQRDLIWQDSSLSLSLSVTSCYAAKGHIWEWASTGHREEER